MHPKKQKRASKFLSLLLRHKPETIGLELDRFGRADVDELLNKINKSGFDLTFEELQTVVAENNKKRFSFSEDRTKIRANQGHSIDIELNLKEQKPPDILYHGTAKKNLPSIREKGLLKQKRHHVHLSKKPETAQKVGLRYGKPVVLKIRAHEMHERGSSFYLSENGVWLTDHVPAGFIEFPH